MSGIKQNGNQVSHNQRFRTVCYYLVLSRIYIHNLAIFGYRESQLEVYALVEIAGKIVIKDKSRSLTAQLNLSD